MNPEKNMRLIDQLGNSVSVRNRVALDLYDHAVTQFAFYRTDPIATIDGTESCTLWQHASLRFQLTTAVAYAIEHYVNITGDKEFLKAEGAEMLIQICRFLASRGQWSPQTAKFGYYAVMGPDEFQMMVNNNCYTN